MKTRKILAALALLVAPGTAFAADGINCIATKLDPSVVVRIGDGVVALSDKAQPFDASLDADRDAVIAARDACRKANKWSNDAADLAMGYFKAGAVVIGAERALVGDGFSLDALKTAYAAMSVADRKSIIIGPQITNVAMDTVIRLVDASKPDPAKRDRLLRRMTIYFGSMSAIEFYPAEFATL